MAGMDCKPCLFVRVSEGGLSEDWGIAIFTLVLGRDVLNIIVRCIRLTGKAGYNCLNKYTHTYSSQQLLAPFYIWVTRSSNCAFPKLIQNYG